MRWILFHHSGQFAAVPRYAHDLALASRHFYPYVLRFRPGCRLGHRVYLACAPVLTCGEYSGVGQLHIHGRCGLGGVTQKYQRPARIGVRVFVNLSFCGIAEDQAGVFEYLLVGLPHRIAFPRNK